MSWLNFCYAKCTTNAEKLQQNVKWWQVFSKLLNSPNPSAFFALIHQSLGQFPNPSAFLHSSIGHLVNFLTQVPFFIHPLVTFTAMTLLLYYASDFELADVVQIVHSIPYYFPPLPTSIHNEVKMFYGHEDASLGSCCLLTYAYK